METIFPPINDRLVDTILSNGTFAVMSHIAPDGDAVFSSLALEKVLESLGKKVFLLSDGPFRRREVEKFESRFSSQATDEIRKETDVAIILDCSTPDRPGKVYGGFEDKPLIVIDHHSSGEVFYDAELSYIVPSSPSTTLLVDRLRRRLGVELDKESAEYIMTGFLTDTGFFHFLSSVQAPEALEAVADLARAGASPYELYDRLHDGRSLCDVRTIARIMEEVESYYEGRLLVACEKIDCVTDERPGDTVYSTLLEVRDVKVVLLLKEMEDGVEIGFRAKNGSGVDVGSIAGSLGGGGHRLAAGATVKNVSLDEARRMAISLFDFLA